MPALGRDDEPRVLDKQSTTYFYSSRAQKKNSVYTLEISNNNNASRLTTLAKLT